mgnify:CR=1 FL=1
MSLLLVLFSPSAIFLTPSSNYKWGARTPWHTSLCTFVLTRMLILVWIFSPKNRLVPSSPNTSIYMLSYWPQRRQICASSFPSSIVFICPWRLPEYAFDYLITNHAWNRCSRYFPARSPYHYPLVSTMLQPPSSNSSPAK